MITVRSFTFLALSMLFMNNSYATNNEQKLTILHTNDHHGRFWRNEQGEYGMAARKTLIDRLRAEAKAKNHQVLLLSGGDINTGVPESDLQYAEPDFKGMSLIGYDAMAIGNHEFDNSLDVLDKQIAWANFPLLSANIFNKKTGEHAYQPYQIIKRDDLTIAVIGLTTVDTAKIANPDYVGHFEFRTPADAAAPLLEKLEKTYQPDITIAVTHMGHYVNAEHGINAPGDVTLARTLNAGALDLIIGGHSQEPVCMEGDNTADSDFLPGDECRPDRQNGTWIMQAHEWGKYVGKAEFSLKNNVLTLLSYELIPVNMLRETKQDGQTVNKLASEKIPEDPKMLAFLTPYQEKGSAKISQPIGELIGDLEGSRNKVRFVQTNLGRLIAKAQSESVGADFGIISGGGIRDSIKAGDVSYKDILQVHPFKNRITYLELKGQELVDYISLAASFPPDSGAYCQFYGIELKKENDELTITSIGNKPFDANKRYRFTLNSYNAAGGDGYPNMTKHPHFVATDTIDAEVLKNYFLQNSPVDATKI
ncbi:bifunctional UDP-sugar hydrolase/5'-nucleotidase [Pseudoalteromonas spongiae]|nr:bifunctional UDP-sugar hydrolase/5'-nucleotidase [Pseudoalteromonas spongiae]